LDPAHTARSGTDKSEMRGCVRPRRAASEYVHTDMVSDCAECVHAECGVIYGTTLEQFVRPGSEDDAHASIINCDAGD